MFRGDQVLWAQGFGLADPRMGVPAGVRTIYRTGSISKSVTAVLLVDLVEKGLLGLDDQVNGALPEIANVSDPPAGMSSITYRQLASHTAGLVREPELEGAAAGPIEDWGHQILASIHRTSFYARGHRIGTRTSGSACSAMRSSERRVRRSWISWKSGSSGGWA